jgi:hypothetical protein
METIMNYILWNIGCDSDGYLPTFGKKSTSKVMRALIMLDGRLHRCSVMGKEVFYQISLPVGLGTEFEDLAGYTLTTPKKEQ